MEREKFVRVTITIENFGLRLQPTNASNSGLPLEAALPTTADPRQEVRCAVRFPLALPVVLSNWKWDSSSR
jgi:hypothetical protein